MKCVFQFGIYMKVKFKRPITVAHGIGQPAADFDRRTLMGVFSDMNRQCLESLTPHAPERYR